MKKHKIILYYNTLLFFIIINTIKAQIPSFQHTYGLAGFNYGIAAIQTPDSGFVILGNKSGFSGNTDIYIIKTNKYGLLQWDKAIGDQNLLWANDFKQTLDKGFIITGYINSLNTGGYDFLIIKTDSLANVEWQKNFGGPDWDMANSVAIMPNVGYIIAGKTYNNTSGMADAFIAGINFNGDTLWTKTFGGLGDDVINCIDTTHDGNFIAAGYTNSFGNGNYDFFMVKITPNGDTLWTRTFGHAGDDKAYSVRPTIDGGYVIVGSSNSPPTINLDPWLVKTNSNGIYLWDYIYFNNQDEEFFDVKQKTNGLYVMTGYTTTWGWGNKELFTHVVLGNGDFLHGHTFGGYSDDIGYTAGYASDGGYFFTGTTDSKGIGLTNIFFVKTDSNCYADTNSTHVMGLAEITPLNNYKIKLFPNPVKVNNQINVLIELENEESNLFINISDYLGNSIYSNILKINNHQYNLQYNIGNVPTGVYCMSVKGDYISKTVKFIVVK
ncbi:MAG TPA: hypothetical protein P5250_03850 [Bacteroidales bacterium]|nr:hypothetical protein [Bacteroidales bacterium]